MYAFIKRSVYFSFFLFLILAPSFLHAEVTSEFNELNLRVTPSYEIPLKNPAGYDSTFSIGGHLSFLFHTHLGINSFYQYTPYEAGAVHRIGGGPLVRLLDLSFLRAEIEGHAAWVKTLGKNHFSWGSMAFISYPFKSLDWAPFIGPYVSYDKTYLSNQNLNTFSMGLLIAITGKTDWD